MADTQQRVRFMDVKEFREQGYLQELNRLFLHPLGLALKTVVDVDGRESLGEIWDCRSNAEGVAFDRKDLEPLAAHIRALWDQREPDRVAALGWMVQPEALRDE